MPDHKEYVTRSFEIAIRLGLALGLIILCFQIVAPFLSTMVWGIIIAIAVFPVYRWLLDKFGDRRGLTATLLTALLLIAILTPTFQLSATLVESSRELAAKVENGTLTIPPPSDRIKSWPFIGEQVHTTWLLASENVEEALSRHSDKLKPIGSWLLSAAAGAGMGVLHFAASLVVAGIFLAYFEGGGNFARRIGARLAGEQGEQFARLASSTVRSVAQGVLGVAFIQSLLAGIGFLAVGIPGAGLWTLICLMLATVQVGTALVMVPTVIYVFNTADTTTAVLYTIWAVFVSVLDNVLKPIFLGRGVSVPMAVIFIGAIGGFILMGIVGLFVGAVLMVLAYDLFFAWMNPESAEQEPAAADQSH